MKNLLFILADQFRHDALGRVNPYVKTPNLDKLADAGGIYTNAYTPLPVCAPARQALYTGAHPDSFGAFWNYNFFTTPTIKPEGTWPLALSEKGYAGAFVGKWNVSEVYSPKDFGYDTVISASEYKDTGHYTGGWLGCESDVPLDEAKTHWLARRAGEFIDAQNGPWQLFLDFGMPHLPCRPSPPFSQMYDPDDIAPWPGWADEFINKPFIHKQQTLNWRLEDMEWSEMAGQVARYYGMCSQIDDAIGRLLEHVNLNDTIVVFTSDHGDMCGSHRMLDKHYVLYDDIVRVPLIIAGDERGRIDRLVSNCLDIPVTLARLFDIPAPKVMHGQDLISPAREYITSSGNGQQFGMFNTRMITDGQVKYVWNMTDIDEFYDLTDDPGETRNLINEREDEVRKLRLRLYEELTRHSDPFVKGDWISPQLTEGRKAVRS